jgi:hypothetical protein
LVAAAVAACTDATGPQDQLALLEGGVRKWYLTGPDDYEYTIQRLCECTLESSGPVVVVVRGGEVEARRYSTGAAVDPQYEGLFTNVPGLFDLIRGAFDLPAAALSVRYNGRYGYPESIQIDWVAGAVDDEVSYNVTEFTPLPSR